MTDQHNIDLNHPDLYLNRDLSMLEFNQRVLDLANDGKVPLLERLRFLCIFASNLDEFFEVRIAYQKQRLAMGSLRNGADGLSASEVLDLSRQRVLKLVQQQYQILNDDLLPAMRDEGITFLHRTEWSDNQKKMDSNLF